MKLNKKQKTIFLIIDILLVLIVLLFFTYIYNKEPVIIKYKRGMGDIPRLSLPEAGDTAIDDCGCHKDSDYHDN